MTFENTRIDIWGDSIMKGIVLDETDGRYRVPQKNCVARFAEITGAAVMNHASFGMTVGKAFERITRSLARKLPGTDEIALLEYGGNDCDFNWAEISANPEGGHFPKTPLDRFAAILQSIIDLFRSFRIEPVLMSLPPLDADKYFAWLSRGLNIGNLRSWLGDINRIYRWQEAYNNVVRQTANRNGLFLIDVRQDFLISGNYGAKMCADGIHPNESGQTIILESALSAVRQI
ncbi:MAG: GDSL family lipase [Treponema sp. RIFOXYC1_FULL_61_9]|nr:MAG: GDSL family lipase [Treponema sp. RIFOXYC1_FULL_61_9]